MTAAPGAGPDLPAGGADETTPDRAGTGARPPLRRWPLARSVLTAVNGTTLAGLAVAVLTGAKVRRCGNGILVAEGYRRKVPPATCFTVGSVIITRRSAEWLLHEDRADLLAHESRHAGQYAVLGPLFWPAYWAACGYSWLMTGGYGSRNLFERHAGLERGGYARAPLRPWVRRLRPKPGPHAAPPDEGQGPAGS